MAVVGGRQHHVGGCEPPEQAAQRRERRGGIGAERRRQRAVLAAEGAEGPAVGSRPSTRRAASHSSRRRRAQRARSAAPMRQRRSRQRCGQVSPPPSVSSATCATAPDARTRCSRPPVAMVSSSGWARAPASARRPAVRPRAPRHARARRLPGRRRAGRPRTVFAHGGAAKVAAGYGMPARVAPTCREGRARREPPSPPGSQTVSHCPEWKNRAPAALPSSLSSRPASRSQRP